MLLAAEELRAVIDCVSEAVVYKDAEGRVRYINQAAEDILGLKVEQAQGLSPAQYTWRGIHEDGSPCPLDRHPSLVTLRTGTPLRDQVIGMVRPDQGVVWLSINTLPVYAPGDDKPSGVVASFRDITQARQAAKEARLNQERLRVALAPVDLAVFHQDRELRYTWVFKPQLGYSIKEIVGKTDAELLPEAAARVVTRIKRGVMAKGEGAREEVLVDAADGQHIYDLVAEPLRNGQGAIVGITGASLDISQPRQALQRKNQELEKQAQKLLDLNAALRVLLDQRQQDRRELETRLADNLDRLVKFHLERLMTQGLNPDQQAILEVVLSNLRELCANTGQPLHALLKDLTPREAQVAQMVRNGQTSKEIAGVLGLSVRSVDFYRRHLRQKLGLAPRQGNLRTLLLSLK